ncbi:MAG: cytidine deaminase [Actinobacteria bacterium]|nr:cytidine deaminase [Actinomycetota bacterium]
MSNSFSNPEDQKLATLATSTLVRTGAKQAAALRDTTGRTYVAINISAPQLTLDAVQAVFTVAAASQIAGIESVVIAGEKAAMTAVITDNSPQAAIFHIDANGSVTRA